MGILLLKDRENTNDKIALRAAVLARSPGRGLKATEPVTSLPGRARRTQLAVCFSSGRCTNREKFLFTEK